MTRSGLKSSVPELAELLTWFIMPPICAKGCGLAAGALFGDLDGCLPPAALFGDLDGCLPPAAPLGLAPSLAPPPLEFARGC